MEIMISQDIEDVIRQALDAYLYAYCRPLPKDFNTPCILVTQVGGPERDMVGTYDITLDARAKTDSDASLTLRTAIGILRKVASDQTTPIRHVSVNSSGAWGNDPVRPDLKMCSARITVVAHLENITII